MTNNKSFFCVKKFQKRSLKLFLISLIFTLNIPVQAVGAMPTHARYQDFITNNINVIFTPDFFPIIFYDISKYNINPTVTDAVDCVAVPNKCSDVALGFGAIKFKFYNNPDGGLIVFYFDISNSVIGYGLDFDGDDFGDLQDNDIDNDGVLNADDAFDYDPNEWADSDGDGVGDNADAFPFNPNEVADNDGDGVGDNADAFPSDPNETVDSNGNGVGDNFEAIPTDLKHKIRAPLKGEFKVNESGAAVYSLPITLPPGINNNEPKLGFVYSSAKRRGSMRMGWSLSGLSAISRCSAKKARDGFIQAVKLDVGEKQRFCLDGQPLILIPGGSNGLYGQDGTEYVTEIRNDLLIKARGQSGNGPDYFEVKTGEGKTIVYGNEPKSKRYRFGIANEFGFGSKVKGRDKDEIIIWKMDSVTDRNGSQAQYEYHTDSVSATDTYSYLSKIRYTGNISVGTTDIEVDFNWSKSQVYNDWSSYVVSTSIESGTTLANISEGIVTREESNGESIVDGVTLSERFKLDEVVISVGGNQLRNYVVGYDNIQTTGQPPVNNVRSITECTQGICTQPIQFDWEHQHQGEPTVSQCVKDSNRIAGGEPAFSTSYKKSVPYTKNFGWGGGNYYARLLGDFNKDDLTDIAVVYTYGDGGNSRMTADIAYSNGDGTFSPGGTSYSEIIGAPILNHRLSGDVNNDGYTDLIATNSSANGWNVYTVLNNRDGSFASPLHQKVSTTNFTDDKTYQKVTGDFNGDGNLDIMAYGIGLASQKNDTLFSRANGLVAYVALGNGDGTFTTAQGGQLATTTEIAKFLVKDRKLFTGDFNGDGITDIASAYSQLDPRAYTSPYIGTEMIVAFGTESGIFEKPVISRWSYASNPHGLAPTQRGRLQTADINGDGLTDIISASYYGGILDYDAYLSQSLVTADQTYVRSAVVSMISNGDGTFRKEVYEDVITQEFRLERYFNTNCEHTYTEYGMLISDFNRDGFSDISFGSNDFYLGRGNGLFLRQGSRAISGDDVKPTGGGLTIGSFAITDTTHGAYAFDVNRDGVPDAVEIVSDKDGLRVGTNTYAENINQQYITKITDGFGRQIDIKYEAISKGQAYTKGNSAIYPYRDIGSGSTVVSKVTISDGIGGKYNLDYKYSGLVADLYRNERLGFTTMSFTDSRDNTTTTNTYAQPFPLTGRLLKRETRLKDGALVSATNTEWTHNSNQNLIGNYSYNWYTINKDTESKATYNDDGVSIGVFTQAYSQHDIYGKPARITKTSSDGYQTVVDYGIENNSVWDNYYIGRVKSSSETRTTPDFTGSIVRTKEFTYYPNGLLESEIVEPYDTDLLKRTDYVYDGYGRVISTTLSGHAAATYPVSPRTATVQFNMPTLSSGLSASDATPFEMEVITTNAENHVSKEYIDVRFGHATRSIDANGLETVAKYDVSGDLTQTINPDNTITTYTRDTCNLHCPPNAVYSVFVNSTGNAYKESYFDIYDREIRARSIGLNNRMIYQDNHYDALGRVTYTSQPYFTDDNIILASTMDYDDLGRVENEYSPEEGLTNYDYSGLNGLGSQVIKTQNRSGLNGITTIRTEHNRNLSDLPVQITNADNFTTKYRYDAFSNLKQTIDPYNNVVTVVYDGLGRTLSLIDPDLGTRNYGVDAFDQIRFQSDDKDQQVILSYDDLGRLTSRNKKEGIDTWEYDNGPNAIGKLVTERASTGSSKTLQYDALSRIDKETHLIGNTNFVLQNGYDYAGRLNSITYPTGFSVVYGYNSVSGDLESVSNGNTVYWKADALNAKGERLIETFANGLTTTRKYHDINGRINSILTGANAAIQNLTFTFDSIGNLDSRADLNKNKDERFSYDNLNRLKDIYLNGTKTGTHDYDAIGNIKTKSDFGSGYIYGQNNAGPHAVTEVTDLNSNKITYAYDNNGNMLSGDGRTITPTSFDKPLSITKAGKTSQFEYDANQMRVKQVNGSEITTYINPRWDTGVHYEKEQSASNVKHKHYINAGNIPVAVYTTIENSSLTELRFLHKDHLGSVSTITDEGGNVVEDLSYHAFGERRNSDWSSATSVLTSTTTHHGFTGHEHLDSLDIIHMNARLYDPNLGRFLSADSIIPSKQNLEAFNRYTYVYNNPLSLTDPSGHAPSGSGGLFGWIDSLFSSMQSAYEASKSKTQQTASNPHNVNQSSEGVSSRVGNSNSDRGDDNYSDKFSDNSSNCGAGCDEQAILSGLRQESQDKFKARGKDEFGSTLGEFLVFLGIDLTVGKSRGLGKKAKEFVKNNKKKTKAAPHTVVNSLKKFKGQNYQFGNNKIKLDKSGLKHILERHHPSFWNGTKKAQQTFFSSKMSVGDVHSAIGSVLRQNRSILAQRGSKGMYQIQGSHGGVDYVLGLNRGRVGQFFPK